MSIKAFDITKEYNREVFLDFLRDFLPDDFEQIEEQTFFEFTNIEEGYKLGFSDSLNLDVYEFRTKSNRDPRVTLTKEVVSCIKNYGYNPNALAIFYSLESNSWRFSLITTDYSFEDGKLKRTYSNPRRFSFKLGKDCKRHTPEQMLFSKGQIRERTENGKTLTVIEDLKSRFAIEVVSNEFFNEYKVFYEDFVQYITGNRFVKTSGNKYEKKPISEQNKEIFNQFEQIANGDYELACKYVRDYIKKLMGRLVFLHFLQKKGWLGVNEESLWGDGNKSYLLDLFKNSSSTEQENFLDKVLKPLFFGMLNTPEAERKALFEEKKWNSQLLSIFNRIPYLNGGLFESDKLDELKVIFPKELFSNEKSPDKERKYQGAIQDYPFTECCGLLDFFERYNFTIDETDPSDMEIGVDPEMLGKIFENLLEDNKDKGAFYTPKEIVQYMCRESLIAYLLTDSTIEKEKIRDFVISHSDNFIESEKSELIQKLKSVKICDPAVGSGAFPMGMLNELYACRHVIEEDTSPVDIKKEIVKENIYGVDIEKGAVDIARLRFWLAIIVDETEPIPLPNLDYKIMQGNSLLECYEGIDLSNLSKSLENDLFGGSEQTIKKLVDAINGYFVPNDKLAKDKIRKQIEEYIYILLRERNLQDAEYEKLKKIDLHENNKFFLWHTWFNDVFNRPNDCNGGFDIVIGNPPYVESRNSIFSDELKDNLQKNIRLRYKEEDRRSFPRGADLLIFFFELSFRLLNKNGINTFITENSWLSTDYGKDFQTYLLKYIDIQGIVDSDYKYFETADINTIISFFKLNNGNKVLPVNFFHTHENLEKYPCNTSNPELNNNCIELKTFNNTDSILKKYKWGFIYSTEKKLIDLVEKMDNLQDCNIKKKISIGQGLNLTKDKILKSKTKNCAPFFTSETGPILTWTETETYVDKKNISSSRKIPLLILPRGLGTHFCCMNEISGYSTSFVEIYEEEELTEQEKLNLWLFCNSSLLWLLREYTGRCNLGGGMLKAEATDLKTIPLCFNFGEDSEIKNIYKLAKNYFTPGKIETAINSELHKRIDKIVYSYFGLEQDNNFVTEMLVARFNWRNKKSKTN